MSERKLRCADLYCGLGGLSKGFFESGFEVLGVEIEEKIAKLYPYPVLVKDVKKLKGKQFQDYDVIVGSPPCREFSQFRSIGKLTWKKPPNIYEGLENVYAFFRIIQEAKPKFWLMENVPNLAKHIIVKPKMTTYLSRTMRRSFWGNFPPFLVPRSNKMPICTGKWDSKLRKWQRAKIPFAFSFALAQACKDALLKNFNVV